jgi:LAO/AO transport system kinase
MWAHLHERLHEKLVTDPMIRGRAPAIERAVADGSLSPNAGADELAGLLGLRS